MIKKTSEHMENAPLAYVIAQLRISQILKMQEYISDIQTALIKEYPSYKENVIHSIEITNQPNISVKDQQQTRWEFSNVENTMGFLLSDNSLTFHTTDYKEHNDFFEKIRIILGNFEEIIPDMFINSIGLRYVDIILPKKDEEIGKYFESELIGDKLLSLNPINIQDLHQSTLTFNDGQLIFRYNIISKNSAFSWPQDLYPLSLKPAPIYEEANTNNNINRAILDFDRMTNQRLKINTNILIKHFERIQKDTSAAFKAITSLSAKKTWSGKNG